MSRLMRDLSPGTYVLNPDTPLSAYRSRAGASFPRPVRGSPRTVWVCGINVVPPPTFPQGSSSTVLVGPGAPLSMCRSVQTGFLFSAASANAGGVAAPNNVAVIAEAPIRATGTLAATGSKYRGSRRAERSCAGLWCVSFRLRRGRAGGRADRPRPRRSPDREKQGWSRSAGGCGSASQIGPCGRIGAADPPSRGERHACGISAMPRGERFASATAFAAIFTESV